MDMYRCDICPMSFLTESGVRRHLLCSHGRRFHRGRPSSLVPMELLEAAVQRSRAAQANRRQRRRVRAIQRAPPVNPPPVVGTELDGMLDDFLQGWPDVPPLVVKETATQHDVSWRDASTSTDRQAFNAAVQAGPPTLSGPGLPALPELVRWAAHHAVTRADLPPDRIVQSLLEGLDEPDLMAPGAPRELLDTVIAVACRPSGQWLGCCCIGSAATAAMMSPRSVGLTS